MKLENFRSYQLAKELYQALKNEPIKGYARDQILRASHSVCLNLAEGSAKPSTKERRRFYTIAMASTRELQAALDLDGIISQMAKADHLGGSIYKLIRQLDG